MSKLVLVCEDRDTLRELVRAALDDRYRVSEARDAAEALALALELRPDLIVLDLMLPGRSGLEFLLDIRKRAGLADTPVIVLTARTQTADREAAARAGISRYLTKPFSLIEFSETVDELIAAS